MLQPQQEAVGAASAAAASYEALDMTAVRKHVEDMAAQYVAGLRKAEAELQVVRSVWQQAEDELAAMRSSPRNSNDGSRAGASPRGSLGGANGAGAAEAAQPGSPRLMTASGKVAPDDFNLVRGVPAGVPQTVSGSSHAGAEAEHGMPAYVVELPSPRFGGGHVGNFPEGYQGAAAAATPSRVPVVAAERTEAEQYAQEAQQSRQRAAAQGA